MVRDLRPATPLWIILHIARIERRYVVVWPWESRSAETTSMTAAVEMALERLRGYAKA